MTDLQLNVISGILTRLQYTAGLNTTANWIKVGMLPKECGEEGMLYIPISREDALEEIVKIVEE